MKLNIINFNVKNNTKKKNYDGGDSPKKLREIIKGYNVNVACLQEVNDNYKNKLKKYLPDFKFYGNNRFKKNSLLYKRYNEINGIVSNLDTEECKTLFLTKDSKQNKRNLFSIFPCMATIIKLKCGIIVINTHLDYLSSIARKKHLEYLKDIIREYKEFPIILTGGFNLNTNDELFEDFIIFMEACGSKLVPINTNTYKGTGKLCNPDHIFIPNNYNINNLQVLDTALSDHRLIVLEIESK